MKKILVIGDIMLDIYVNVSVDRISPEAPVPVMTADSKYSRPGGAANVAQNIIALGCESVLLGVTGIGAPITGQYITIDESRVTTTKTRFVAPNGQQIARLDEECSDQIGADIEAKLMLSIEEAMKDCDCVVISDYKKGVCTWNVVHYAILSALSMEIPVIVDPKRDNWEIYEGATLITPNEREWEAHLRNDADCSDFSAVLVTKGERGMELITQSPANHSEPVIRSHFSRTAAQVFDVTGAGDTVVATLAVFLSRGFHLNEACRMANLAGSLVVGKRGTATVTMEELTSHESYSVA